MIKESEAWLFYMPKVWDILKVDYRNLSSEYVGVCFYNTFNFSICLQIFIIKYWLVGALDTIK